LSELREGGTALSCNLLLAGTVGEETTKVGAQRFKAWLASRSLVLDELLVAEPTLCQPIHGHKGVCRMQFDLEGLAVHSSQPEQGRNALLAAAAVVQAFQAEHAALQQQQPSPLGPPTLAVTKLSSGVGQNIVPPAATVCIDRRVVIGELAEDVVRQLTALASDHATRAVPGIKVHTPPPEPHR
jgi:acetylornithine deacetylase/succinyl-diaminopimelate desuccinylase-like protein